MEAIAKLNRLRIAPRKMQLVAAMVRGMQVDKALSLLQYSQKKGALPMRKLLLSAVDNWFQKNVDQSPGQTDLFIKTVYVNGAGMIKRFKPAPQGRSCPIRKRFSHTIVVVGGGAQEAVGGKLDRRSADKKSKSN